ncbi:hypothetical protein DBR42_09835 [Pelomonas sp. HMWF004]|nr:hypothetical protein DBR42_09835 [Pelomonas sp. HMWF004]
MTATTLIRPGLRVLSWHGEEDTDGETPRSVIPGTWGHIAGLSHLDTDGTQNWHVTFPNGCKVILTSTELADKSQYELAKPASGEQLLLSVQWMQRATGLPEFQEPMAADLANLAENAGDLLKILDCARNLVRKLSGIPGINPRTTRRCAPSWSLASWSRTR